MSRIARPVGAVTCLALLLLKVSGMHVHADAAGFIGAPETAYAHGHAAHHVHDGGHGLGAAAMPGSDHASPGVGGSPDEHGEHPAHGAGSPEDHGDVRDVSLLETAIGTGKLPIAIVALLLLFAVFALTKTLASADIVYPVLSGRHTRWRPPLRAPPQPA